MVCMCRGCLCSLLYWPLFWPLCGWRDFICCISSVSTLLVGLPHHAFFFCSPSSMSAGSPLHLTANIYSGLSFSNASSLMDLLNCTCGSAMKWEDVLSCHSGQPVLLVLQWHWCRRIRRQAAWVQEPQGAPECNAADREKMLEINQWRPGSGNQRLQCEFRWDQQNSPNGKRFYLDPNFGRKWIRNFNSGYTLQEGTAPLQHYYQHCGKKSAASGIAHITSTKTWASLGSF